MEFLRFLFRRHPWASGMMALALAALVWFGGHFVKDAVYFSNPAHSEQPLALWMTPRYVAKSWKLPPEVVARVMEIKPDHRRLTLAAVVDRLGISLAELEARVRAAKAEQESGGPSVTAPASGGGHD